MQQFGHPEHHQQQDDTLEQLLGAGIPHQLDRAVNDKRHQTDIQRVHYLDDIPLILNHNYFRKSETPGLTAQIAEDSIYEYLENTLHMTIVNSKRVISVEKITQIDEKYLQLNAEDYNCLAVISSHTYNSDGIMFEFTQSRHRPDYFRFQDNALRRG